MISNNWYNVYGGMMTNKTEGKDPMKRLLQVLALASALTLCASSAVGEAYAHPTYLSIVSSDSAALGAAEQPFGYGTFSARYPGYISYEGDGYAATGHTEGWCDADRLFTAGGFFFEVTNCESFVSLRKEADQNSERILKVNKGEQVYVNGEYGAWSLCLYSGRYGWIKSQYLRSVDPWFNSSKVHYSNVPYDDSYGGYYDNSYDDDGDDSNDDYYYDDLDDDYYDDYYDDDYYDYPYSERALSSDEVEAYASSELTDAYGSYPAWKAYDGYTTSTWSEGVSGIGRGEYLGFRFEPAYVSSLSIWCGFHKDTRRYYKNNRPKEIGVWIGDEYQGLYEFDDTMTEHALFFDEPIYADNVELLIYSVYKGNECSDTCISEVEIRVLY